MLEALARIAPEVDPATLRADVALRRQAELDAAKIEVEVADGAVTLTGALHSWAERREAEFAAWAAPGVTRVDDRLTVQR